MGRKTALHPEHTRLGARMVDFHGWELPVQYEGILAEHRHCREAACLFDTSHMGQVLIRARPAELARVTTQDAAALAVGRGRYGLLLSEAGGILDDTILMRLDDEEFLLVVNAATAEADLQWVGAHLPAGSQVVDQSAEGWGKLDVQGPASAQVLGPLADVDLVRLGYFDNARAKVCGLDCIVSRTGYTGELGYELFAPGESIVAIFRELASDRRVRAAGLGARDSLRLEMGYPLYGADMDARTDPFEAGLDGFVRLDRDFVGSMALKQIAAAGPRRMLAAFAANGRQRAWRDNAVCRHGREVGVVTSAAFSPSLNVSIGMGYVAAGLAEPGTELTIRTGRRDLTVAVADKPLYKHGSCRTKDFWA